MSWPGYPLVGLNSRSFLFLASTALPLQGSTAALPAMYILALSFDARSSSQKLHRDTLTACVSPRNSFDLATANSKKPKTTRESSIFIRSEQKLDHKDPKMTPLSAYFSHVRFERLKTCQGKNARIAMCLPPMTWQTL